jgi:hypothetical protein
MGISRRFFSRVSSGKHLVVNVSKAFGTLRITLRGRKSESTCARLRNAKSQIQRENTIKDNRVHETIKSRFPERPVLGIETTISAESMTFLSAHVSVFMLIRWSATTEETQRFNSTNLMPRTCWNENGITGNHFTQYPVDFHFSLAGQ